MAERARAQDLYLSGATYAEIGRQLKRDPTTVKKMIQALPAGLSLRARAGPAP